MPRPGLRRAKLTLAEKIGKTPEDSKRELVIANLKSASRTHKGCGQSKIVNPKSKIE